MKKEHSIWSLLMIMYVFLALFGQTSYAFSDQEKTDTGISFNEFVESEQSETAVYEANKPKLPSTSGTLPNLGQMMGSFIFLFLGAACLVICIGIICLRKVYLTNV